MAHALASAADPRRTLACLLALRLAGAAECSKSPHAWRGPRLAPSIPPYGNRTQLLTDWGLNVTATPGVDDHPNPLMRRAAWCSLNGVWELDRFVADLSSPPFGGGDLPETILVPFPIESALSGVRNTTASDVAWYRRTFSTTIDAPRVALSVLWP